MTTRAVRSLQVPRVSALVALVAVTTSCDALIGLGDEPSGGAPSSSSTGDATTSTGTSSTSTGDVTSSSGGGGVAIATGAGGDGGTGDGGGTSASVGSGGGAVGPCGPCDGKCEDCDGGPTCKIREYPPMSVYARGVDVGNIINRLGRGMAVTDEIIAFWAYEAATGDPTLFVVDRLTEVVETIPLPGGFVSLDAAASGTVLLADSLGGLRELRRGASGGWELVDVDLLIPPIGTVAGGASRFVLGRNFTGEAWALDPDPLADPESNPCPLNSRTLGTTPIDTRVRLLDGEVTALLLGLQPVGDEEGVPYLVTSVGSCNTSPTVRLTLPLIDYGMAFDAIETRRYIKGLPDVNSLDTVLAVLDEEGGVQATMETNASRGLAVRASGVLVPLRDGGLERRSLDLASAAAEVLTVEQIGQVHAIEARSSGLIALGLSAFDDTLGEARLVCVDDEP